MRPRLLVPGSLILLALAMVPLPGNGQEATREPVSHGHVISGGPLLLLADGFNGEYERKVREALTLGIAGGWLDLDKGDYTYVNGFLRYYFKSSAFMGFYVGSRGGVFKVDEGEDSHTALGLGIDAGYAWLLGPGRSFYLGLGIGATHLFPGDLGDAPSVLPVLRLLDIGIAF